MLIITFRLDTLILTLIIVMDKAHKEQPIPVGLKLKKRIVAEHGQPSILLPQTKAASGISYTIFL